MKDYDAVWYERGNLAAREAARLVAERRFRALTPQQQAASHVWDYWPGDDAPRLQAWVVSPKGEDATVVAMFLPPPPESLRER